MPSARRDLLRSIAIAGSVGLAGCLGGASSDPATEQPETDPPNASLQSSSGRPSTGASTTTGTPTTIGTPTPASPSVPRTTSPPPSTSAGPSSPTSTLVPADECDDTGAICTEPEHLLEFDAVPPEIPAGTTTTVAGTVHNPYLFEVTGVEVALAPSPPDWTIEPVRGTHTETLPQKTGRGAAWDVTVPASAGGEYGVEATTRYVAGRYVAEVTRTHAVRVAEA